MSPISVCTWNLIFDNPLSCNFIDGDEKYHDKILWENNNEFDNE